MRSAPNLIPFSLLKPMQSVSIWRKQIHAAEARSMLVVHVIQSHGKAFAGLLLGFWLGVPIML